MELGEVDISKLEEQQNNLILKSESVTKLILMIENSKLDSTKEKPEIEVTDNDDINKIEKINKPEVEEVVEKIITYTEILDHKENIVIEVNQFYYYVSKKDWLYNKKESTEKDFFIEKEKYETLFYIISEMEINDNVDFYNITKISDITNYTIYGIKQEFKAIVSSIPKVGEMTYEEITNISVSLPDYKKLISILLKFTTIKNNDIQSPTEMKVYGDLIKTYRGFLIFLFEEDFYATRLNSDFINFQTDDPLKRNDIINDVSVYALEELINDELA